MTSNHLRKIKTTALIENPHRNWELTTPTAKVFFLLPRREGKTV
jgi:hypothetical protein